MNENCKCEEDLGEDYDMDSSTANYVAREDYTPNLDGVELTATGLTPINSSDPISSSKPREINIQSLDYGYIVNVGCQSYAIEGIEKLITNLEAYLKDPNMVERKWFKDRKLL